MNDKLNIEDLLKRFRRDPAPRVKRAVLSRYAELCGRRRTPAVAERLWRRPVPLYFALALIVVAAGLSFIGGQQLSRREASPRDTSTVAQDTTTGAPLEQQWKYAPSDIL